MDLHDTVTISIAPNRLLSVIRVIHVCYRITPLRQCEQRQTCQDKIGLKTNQQVRRGTNYSLTKTITFCKICDELCMNRLQFLALQSHSGSSRAAETVETPKTSVRNIFEEARQACSLDFFLSAGVNSMSTLKHHLPILGIIGYSVG